MMPIRLVSDVNGNMLKIEYSSIVPVHFKSIWQSEYIMNSILSNHRLKLTHHLELSRTSSLLFSHTISIPLRKVIIKAAATTVTTTITTNAFQSRDISILATCSRSRETYHRFSKLHKSNLVGARGLIGVTITIILGGCDVVTQGNGSYGLLDQCDAVSIEIYTQRG